WYLAVASVLLQACINLLLLRREFKRKLVFPADDSLAPITGSASPASAGMSFQSRLGCWWVRVRTKKKPKGERALVEFSRRVFKPPKWHVKLHSRGVKIEPVTGPVKGEWIIPPGAAEKNSVVYYLHGGGYISGS